MRAEDRVRAVVEFGFTPRQARFLVLVMRYAGICLLRQYSTFAGIVQEQKTARILPEAPRPRLRLVVRLPTQSRPALSRPPRRFV